MINDIQRQLHDELALGDALFQKISAKEAEWIAAGHDVDELFWFTFNKDDSLSGIPANNSAEPILKAVAVFLVFAGLAAMVFVVRRISA